MFVMSLLGFYLYNHCEVCYVIIVFKWLDREVDFGVTLEGAKAAARASEMELRGEARVTNGRRRGKL